MRISCFDTDFVSQMKLTTLPVIHCFVGSEFKFSVYLLFCVINSFCVINFIEQLSLLPPATKLRQGYVFTRVCDSVHGGVCSGGCLVRGGSAPRAVPGLGGFVESPPVTATAAGGTHPTGMHSCFRCRGGCSHQRLNIEPYSVDEECGCCRAQKYQRVPVTQVYCRCKIKR